MKIIAKLGYMARGLVYAALAYFAVLSALGKGALQDSHGALTQVARMPYGQLVIVVIIAGLAAFSVWRCLQCAMDVDHHGTSGKAWLIRLGLLVSAGTYGTLGVWTVGLLSRHPETSDSTVTWTARFLSQPWGRGLVAVIALALATVALAHFYKAATRRFLRYLQPSADKPLIIHVSQIGLTARGLLFLLFAYFAIRAAWHLDPEQAKDLVHVLRWLQSLPGAQAWTAMIAVGLGAFAIYSFVEGWYRKVPAFESVSSKVVSR